MPDERIVVKFSGLVDLDDALKKIKTWYEKKQFEFHEYSYKGRESQLGELELFWSGLRDDTEYFRTWINCYIRVWDMQDVEVISGGEKKQMTKARIRVNVRLHIESDYRHKWDSSRFFMFLRKFYENNMILMKIYIYADKLEYEVHSFISHIKRSFGMMD